MIKNFKNLFLYFVIGSSLGILFLSIFSSHMVKDIRHFNTLYETQSHLIDSAIICTQLYFLNPTDLNKLTCDKINQELSAITAQLDDSSLTFIYQNIFK